MKDGEAEERNENIPLPRLIKVDEHFKPSIVCVCVLGFFCLAWPKYFP